MVKTFQKLRLISISWKKTSKLEEIHNLNKQYYRNLKEHISTSLHQNSNIFCWEITFLLELHRTQNLCATEVEFVASESERETDDCVDYITSLVQNCHISTADALEIYGWLCARLVTPVLMHWSYHGLAQSHRWQFCTNPLTCESVVAEAGTLHLQVSV